MVVIMIVCGVALVLLLSVYLVLRWYDKLWAMQDKKLKQDYENHRTGGQSE
jgi:hypothetical protein